MKECQQCRREMNPVEVLLGPVCGKCTRLNHQRISGDGISRVFGGLWDEDVEKTPHKGD